MIYVKQGDLPHMFTQTRWLFLLDGLVQVPIVVVLKAMGMESDQEIVQMVGRDPIFAGILNPSLQVWTGIYDTDFTDAWCSLLLDVHLLHAERLPC